MTDDARIKYSDIYCNSDREYANIWELCYSGRATRRNPGKLWITDPYTNNVTVSLPIQQPQQNLEPVKVQRTTGKTVAPKKAKKTASVERNRAKSLAPPKSVRTRAKAAPDSVAKPNSANEEIVNVPTASDVTRNRAKSNAPPKSAPVLTRSTSKEATDFDVSTTQAVRTSVRRRTKSAKAAPVSSRSDSKETSPQEDIVVPTASDVSRKRAKSAAPPKLAPVSSRSDAKVISPEDLLDVPTDFDVTPTPIVENPVRSRAKTVKAAPVSSRSASKESPPQEDIVDVPANSDAPSTPVVRTSTRSRAKSAKVRAAQSLSDLVAEANSTSSEEDLTDFRTSDSVQASPVHRTRSVSTKKTTSSESEPTASRNLSKTIKKEGEPATRKRSGSTLADQDSTGKRARTVVDEQESEEIQSSSSCHTTRSKAKPEQARFTFYEQISENAKNLKKTLKATNFDELAGELLIEKEKSKKKVQFKDEVVVVFDEVEEYEEEEERELEVVEHREGEHTDDDRQLMKFVIDAFRQNPEMFAEIENDMDMFSDWYNNEFLVGMENWVKFMNDPEGSGIEDRDKGKFIAEEQDDGTIVETPVEPYPVIFPLDIKERLRDRLYAEQERRAADIERNEAIAELKARNDRQRIFLLHQIRQRNAQANANNTNFFNNFPK